MQLLWFGTSGELLFLPNRISQPRVTDAAVPYGRGADETLAMTDLIARLARQTGYRIRTGDLWRVRDGPPVLYTTCGAKLHDVRELIVQKNKLLKGALLLKLVLKYLMEKQDVLN